MDTAIVSADDHLDMHTLPPDLWTERLPARYREHAPHVVDDWRKQAVADRRRDARPERQPRLARRQGRGA